MTLNVMILAGGYSSRMGQDKALLVHNGQSLLGHTIQVAQTLSSKVVVVTPWPDRYRGNVPSSIRFVQESSSLLPLASAALLSNPPARSKPSMGPLNGFAQGWHAVSSDWCLLLACDLPYLEASVLRAWWHWILACSKKGWSNSHFSDSDGSNLSDDDGPMASLVAGKRGWEPLCGYYHRRCLPQLRQSLKANSKAFQPWLSRLSIAPYTDVPPHMLFNCNTRSDWQSVQVAGFSE